MISIFPNHLIPKRLQVLFDTVVLREFLLVKTNLNRHLNLKALFTLRQSIPFNDF